jgi:hypothetical protein
MAKTGREDGQLKFAKRYLIVTSVVIDALIINKKLELKGYSI